MFRSRILSGLLLAMFLFMGQATLIPGDVDAGVPFALWAVGYATVVNAPRIYKVSIAVGSALGLGVAANYIYDALTSDDDDDDDDDDSSSSGSSSWSSGDGYGYCSNCEGHYRGSHYCYSRD